MTPRYIYDNIALKMPRTKNIVTHRTKRKKPARFSLHPEPGYAIRGRIWIEKDGELFLGWGRLILLQRIAEKGSISAAAKSMNLAYRSAWLWVEAMNRLAPGQLVITAIGGSGGGQATLTQEAHKAIARYKHLQSSFSEFMQQLH